MKIAVNTRFLLKGKLEGIGWFTYEIIKRIVLAHPEHEFIFFFDRPYDPQFVFAPNVKPVVLAPPARHPFLWYAWFEISVRFALRKFKADAFVSTDGFLSLSTSVPTLLVIHDLAFEHFPEHLPLKFKAYLRYFTPRFARKSKHIVTVSQFSKSDLIKCYKLNPSKISVVYNGANEQYKPIPFDEREQIKTQYANGCEYFVFAGALHPRKNVTNLLHAFAYFKSKQRSNMKLLIIGRYAWNVQDIKLAFELHPYKDDILLYDYMQVQELSRIIGAAYCMVFVSLFEGFGIPILEALKCQVPAIVSNTSSMPEVIGEAGILVDPTNIQEIGEAMRAIYKDEILRTELKKRSNAQSAKFNWDKSATEFYDILEKNILTTSHLSKG
mgnify:CR=1 FL=1